VVTEPDSSTPLIPEIAINIILSQTHSSSIFTNWLPRFSIFTIYKRFFNKILYNIVRFQVLTTASMKMPVFWVFAPCSLVEVYRRFRGTWTWRCLLIALMMETASSSETSVNWYQTTRRNNPEDSHLLYNIHCLLHTVHILSFTHLNLNVCNDISSAPIAMAWTSQSLRESGAVLK
jgi:hypothetical protein